MIILADTLCKSHHRMFGSGEGALRRARLRRICVRWRGLGGALREPERCLGGSGAPSSEEPNSCPAVEPL